MVCVYVSQHSLSAATCSCSWRYAHSEDTETCLAHARTNRRSRISHTCRHLLGLPGRSVRRLQAHSCTRTARDSCILGRAGARRLATDLRFDRDTPMLYGPAPVYLYNFHQSQV